ncbi:MAG: ABC transporter ATP-binding protein [Bryobacteraceae bacterium]
MFCSFCQTYLMMRTGQHAMFDLRRDLMAHLHRLDLSYFDRQPVGRIVTRVTTDVDALNDMLSSGLVAIIGDTFVLTFLLATMLRLSPGMTAALAVLPSSSLPHAPSATLPRTATAASGRRRRPDQRLHSGTRHRYVRRPVVQSRTRRRRSPDVANRDHLDAYHEAIHAYGWFYPVVEFLGVLPASAPSSATAAGASKGELTLGVLVAFFQYGMRFFRPIQDLSEKYGTLQQAKAAGERVFQLLDTKVEINPPAAPQPLPDGTAPIEFDRVWFAYKRRGLGPPRRLLPRRTRDRPSPSSATPAPARPPSSALLLRFYDVQRGSIKVGGVDIRNFSPVELRRRFAIVLQDPFLFTGDLTHNIRLGTDGITDQQVEAAARDVNLGGFLASTPGGLSYEVRERGAGLSTGQKQLISFRPRPRP